MIRKIQFLLFFLFVFSLRGFTQNGKPLSKIIKEGDEFFRVQEFDNALTCFLKVYNTMPEDGPLNYKIGACYVNSYSKSEALPYLIKAKELLGEKKLDLEYYSFLGDIYHITGAFQKAIESYQNFLGILDTIPKSNEIHQKISKTDINRKIEICYNAMDLSSNPIHVKIENLGLNINTIYPEYAPVISADEAVLIFTSRRENTTGGLKDPEDNQFFEDIYISVKQDDKWSEPKPISTSINTPSHDASVGLSPDGQTLFIYRDVNNGDLFSCRLIGEEWTKPVSLGNEINTKYWEPSISINGDGTEIYFSSNKPGSFGGKDLYVSKRLPGAFGFGKPMNLGTVINTPLDEDGPFIHPDGKTLYFSSKGHKTMGGYDIFKSEKDSLGNWSKPENIGYPINTPDDDIYFVLSADGKRGYYASAKDGGFGDKDIYVINMPEEAKKISDLIVLKGIIKDKITDKPVGAKIIIRDNETSEIISITDANSSTGNYLVILTPGRNYGITVDNSDYLFHSENFNIPKLNSFDVIYKNIALQKINVGSEVILKNIFFDTGKATLRKESFNELNTVYKLLVENPKIDVEIGGHTDWIGTEENNQRLSDERAHAVVDFLIKKGIKKERMSAKGYGEMKPIESNETEEGRQANRRTVMEITYINF